MSRLKLLVIVPLLMCLAMFIQAQDTGAACDAYTDDLEVDLSLINIRLEAFAKAPASLRSDYATWQEKRLAWQAITPPDCAVEMHADVIAMYANLGDISAWGLWLEIDPASVSGNRLALEAVERAGASIADVADASAAISGNQADMGDASGSLSRIAERFKGD